MPLRVIHFLCPFNAYLLWVFCLVWYVHFSVGKDVAEKEKQLIIHQGDYFDKVAKQERNKRTFQAAIGLYLKRNAMYRRGHVEFLYAAIDRMNEFEVHK